MKAIHAVPSTDRVKMLRYRLAIFDFDGTLADSGPWFISVFNDIARGHGLRELSRDEIEALRDKDNRAIIREMKVRPWHMPALARDIRRRSSDAAETIPLFPGVPDMLSTLVTAGVELGVVSSNSEDTIRRVLGPSASLISRYSCGARLFGKPKKLDRMRRDFGFDKPQVICIGDEARDVEAARRAGLDSGAVLWGYMTELALRAAKPTLLFSSVDEVVAACTGRVQGWRTTA